MSSAAKPRPVTAPIVFTGNFLDTGRAAWLGQGGAWVGSIAGARVFPPEAATTALAEAQEGERRQRVVGVYAVEVEVTAGLASPRRFRERLRVTGPTNVHGGIDAELAPTLAMAS